MLLQQQQRKGSRWLLLLLAAAALCLPACDAVDWKVCCCCPVNHKALLTAQQYSPRSHRGSPTAAAAPALTMLCALCPVLCCAGLTFVAAVAVREGDILW
jgi:hypothetical protein